MRLTFPRWCQDYHASLLLSLTYSPQQPQVASYREPPPYSSFSPSTTSATSLIRCQTLFVLYYQHKYSQFSSTCINNMRTIKPILLLLGLLLLAHCDEVIRTPDFFGTICQEQVVAMQRVQRLVNVTYTYPLHTIRSYQQFPDMNIKFYLSHKQFVNIAYHISMRTGGNDFFKTRVLIDGQDNPFFRMVTGYLYWRTHSVSHQIYLTEGWHQVKVQYDQSGGNWNQGYDDWAAALFQVEYFDY